ncbi:MAG: Lrp/AsnC family transcriptional regulator [Desulfofustis sp.]|nr:Lrp/AsnC family transcriptional regulator [Desulfofustis sp.]NNK56648.1 Lrp/AsnC family transcriptional regulator [Desulfofustis sp.]
MDNTNLKILRILQKKARIPNIEVSRLINLAPSAVLERIRKMEINGIISGYEVRLNPERFGYPLVSFVQIHLTPECDHRHVADLLGVRDEILEVHFVAGEDCFMIKTRTSGTQQLNDLLRDLTASISGISKTRTFVVLSTQKETGQIPLD